MSEQLTPATEKPARKKSYLVKDLLRLSLVVIPLIGVGWWLNHRFHLDSIRTMEDLHRATTDIRDTLHPDDSLTAQLLSYCYFLIGAVILSTVGWPRWTICALAGMVYGAFLGTVLSTIGTVGGAVVSYFLGGSLLKSMVRRRFGDRMKRFSEELRKDGFGYILHLRLLPGSPGLVTNLVAGACRVKVTHYTLATTIGYMPKTIMFCLLASGAIKSNPWQLAMAVGIYVAFSVAHYYWRKKQKAREVSGAKTEGQEVQ
ncbi:hypothetical protein GC173_08470 [bacterium]|nr:hypothetical protein [bacterium]